MTSDPFHPVHRPRRLRTTPGMRNLAAGTQIYIPFTAEPLGSPKYLVDSHRYQATSWAACNPTTVPDGGTTAALLGLAMAGLGFARRFRG